MLKKTAFNLRKLARRHLQNFSHYLFGLGFSWGRLAALAGTVAVISGLAFNIYFSISQAQKNYKLLEIEREKLATAQSQHDKLSSELEYYSSLEYQQRYAYDSLNLARSGEDLYLVETEERALYEPESTNPDPIAQENPQVWWQLLLDEVFKSAWD
jgi:hypothetical protein